MKTRGLTLVEVLVVIGIIALLAGIGFPVAHRARNNARTVVCSAHIKQLLFGLFAYESQHGFFPYGFNHTLEALINPPPDGCAGDPRFDNMGWWWFNYTTDYSRKKRDTNGILFCPSQPLKDTILRRDVLRSNYGINLSICKSFSGGLKMTEFEGTSLSLADLRHPAQTLLITDAGYSIIAWIYATDEPPEPYKYRTPKDTTYIPGLSINRKRAYLLPEQEYDAFNGRHPGNTVNVGFADGHVSREKAESLLVEKTSDGYKNLSPLWRP